MKMYDLDDAHKWDVVVVIAYPDVEWASLPVGYYPDVEAALKAIRNDSYCSRDVYGNDPGLYIVKYGVPWKHGYGLLYGYYVDVSDWPEIRLKAPEVAVKPEEGLSDWEEVDWYFEGPKDERIKEMMVGNYFLNRLME